MEQTDGQSEGQITFVALLIPLLYVREGIAM